MSDRTTGGTQRNASRYAIADCNGNISTLVDADFDPFGRVLARRRADASGVTANTPSLCPFGFSSRYVGRRGHHLRIGLRGPR